PSRRPRASSPPAAPAAAAVCAARGRGAGRRPRGRRPGPCAPSTTARPAANGAYRSAEERGELVGGGVGGDGPATCSGQRRVGAGPLQGRPRGARVVPGGRSAQGRGQQRAGEGVAGAGGVE